jgi:hypothetical protein
MRAMEFLGPRGRFDQNPKAVTILRFGAHARFVVALVSGTCNV